MAIDIGDAVVNGDSQGVTGATRITDATPATGHGILTSFSLWMSTAGTGVKMGTFSSDGSAKFTYNDHVTLGSVTAGSKQTWTGDTCEVDTNDVLGWYSDVGAVERHSAGTNGIYHVSGDQFSSGQKTFTVQDPSGYLMIHATGTNAPDAPTSVSATDNLTTKVTITWTAGTGETGGHRVYRDGVDISGVVAHGTATYDDTTSVVNISYAYTVKAINASGLSYDSSSNTGVKVTALPEIDYFEGCDTDAHAQALYVSSGATQLQSYSEGTIKTQGSYALKGVTTAAALSVGYTTVGGSSFTTAANTVVVDNTPSNNVGILTSFTANFHASGTGLKAGTFIKGSTTVWTYRDGEACGDGTFAIGSNTWTGLNINCVLNDCIGAYYTTGTWHGTTAVGNYARKAGDYFGAGETSGYTTSGYTLSAYATGYSTDSLNKTLTRTLAVNLDLSGKSTLKYDIRSNRTGSNIKIGLHDTGGTTSEHTANISSANTFETQTWNISAIADANKNAIDSIIITIVNADADNTFYLDNFFQLNSVPSLTTAGVSDASSSGFTANGTITSTGDINPTVRGFCYMVGSSGDPTLANNEVHDDGDYSVGSYSKAITGLDLIDNYRVRAYATNTVGTGYGQTITVSKTSKTQFNYGADVGTGKLSNCDDSTIGTNTWREMQVMLNKSVRGGSLSSNGIVSTYSLVYTVDAAYSGGVLTPNGDIHFIPRYANRGQKISSSGVVSTYSLVKTAANAYNGGVLAPNGDIHFIPRYVNIGQKINISGVVSTYSLVYTADDAYRGGVLAPNGDIHMIPFIANCGQKISSAGVVSTYSLVYTYSSGAYQGGVLAPNGDIHFIPSSANCGQKISFAGVVSTYSLVYTNSSYNGGVLAPNGDIHFVPWYTNRGQKISAAGVVSTYSLIYTVDDAYRGGVLAPNGDIHFIPAVANIGQKVSAAGVVSTYSLIYTNGLNAYQGGVLAPDGNIHMISCGTNCGQKISTNPAIPFTQAVCMSPFFNKY